MRQINMYENGIFDKIIVMLSRFCASKNNNKSGDYQSQ